jgi:hypothetical protein
MALLYLHAHPHLSFQRLCEIRSDVWVEAVPERGGMQLSDIPAMGCTTLRKGGRYHFADEEEYRRFLTEGL